ncbi:NAD(P)/FAD-dependent oxidoreductase [Acidicapsa ligni]|uniref:NAD(P)/FAD-dependent oxidoreductase n=1 Tax=Acidicapsa ligni TaxID=542300 RepID=UPI0021DF6C70|nr:FAD-dependent monooxygenase [Acidicapsa ligni]
MKQSCDVLIVGGGPAGLAAAIALRRRGADVLLADSQRPPIDKACGEGLMPDALFELAQLGVVPRPNDGAPFIGIRFADGHSTVSATFDRDSSNGTSKTGLGVRRLTLHNLLMEYARNVGVRMLWGAPVVLSVSAPPTVQSKPCAYRWIIGADGHASRVRSWAALDDRRLRHRRFGFRAHYRIRPWSEYVEVHWAAAGQAYITPLSQEEICVAVVTSSREVRLQDIIDSVPLLRAKLSGLQCITSERGAITTTTRLRRVTRGNIALLGDASGSVDAITGEGLAISFRQARLLADAIGSNNLDSYASKHVTTLRLPQAMASAMLLMDRRPGLRSHALRALSAYPKLFQKMLRVHLHDGSLRNRR